MKQFWNVLKSRWRNAMPRFFRTVIWIAALISGTALAANEAMSSGGSTPPDWWNSIYPYLLGIPAGMAFVAKFTQGYGPDGRPMKHRPPKAQPPVQSYDDSDVQTAAPDGSAASSARCVSSGSAAGVSPAATPPAVSTAGSSASDLHRGEGFSPEHSSASSAFCPCPHEIEAYNDGPDA